GQTTTPPPPAYPVPPYCGLQSSWLYSPAASCQHSHFFCPVSSFNSEDLLHIRYDRGLRVRERLLDVRERLGELGHSIHIHLQAQIVHLTRFERVQCVCVRGTDIAGRHAAVVGAADRGGRDKPRRHEQAGRGGKDRGRGNLAVALQESQHGLLARI